ncbi:MAG: hypothetical protein UZ03_NOB001003374 [Nitrospira sp. OLB3]|nr:MAG: hypothetical protein UZ03_NOB001003374 [Nitrospira sp. OLB3]
MSKINGQRVSNGTRLTGDGGGARSRMKIIEAIEALQPNVCESDALVQAEVCKVCKRRTGDAEETCSRCGWEWGRPCAETIRRKYLTALACAAVWGIRAILFQQGLRFAGKLAFQALRHLVRYPEQAETIAKSVRPYVVQLGDWGMTCAWPWNPWPRSRRGNFCTEFSPELIMSALSPLEAEAWSVFRINRWPEGRGLCPNKKCSQPAVHHGSECVSGSGKQGAFYSRWLCESFDQRTKSSKSRQAKILQKHPDRMRSKGVPIRRGGCGQYFSDITNTPFNRRVPMVHWFLLIVGDVYAIEVLLAHGLSSGRIIRMVCALHEFSQLETEVIDRLKGNLLGIFVEATKSCLSMGNANGKR